MRRFYRSLNLQSKLMLSYLMVISIPMLLIAVFLYGKVYNMIAADTIRAEQTHSAQAAPAVEAAIGSLLSDFKAVQDIPFYRQVLSTGDSSRLAALAGSEDARHFTKQVAEILADGSPRCVKIYLDLPPADTALLNQATEGIFESFQNTENTYWKGIFAGSGITSLHCPGFYLSNYEIQNYGNMAYIQKEYLYINHGLVLSYSVMYYDAELYLSILEENLPAQGSVSYLINDRDSIIATTSPALSSTYYLNYATIQDSFMSSNNFLQKEVLDETIYAGMYNIKQPGWYMLVVIPSQPLLQKSRLLMFQYVLMFLACIAAALSLAVILSRSITKRLSLVITQMSKVRTGPPVPLAESHIHDEIGELIDTYNYMSREMNRLLKEMEKAGEELRIAEFRSLQAQINPHFLYNTMDMINWMAVRNQTTAIADAVQSLSRFYKLTLSKKGILSTIAQEAEHAGIYLRLQNMRYMNRIAFVADLSDELLDYEIPKLTIQPIVENAVLHGIMEKEEKAGTIVLAGWKEDNDIVLLISDDGVGIAAAELDRILLEKNSSQKGTNIAVYNTHHRLQILYGVQYGLSYSSRPGQGTEVSIRIPAQKNNTNLFRIRNREYP